MVQLHELGEAELGEAERGEVQRHQLRLPPPHLQLLALPLPRHLAPTPLRPRMSQVLGVPRSQLLLPRRCEVLLLPPSLHPLARHLFSFLIMLSAGCLFWAVPPAAPGHTPPAPPRHTPSWTCRSWTCPPVLGLLLVPLLPTQAGL